MGVCKLCGEKINTETEIKALFDIGAETHSVSICFDCMIKTVLDCGSIDIETD